MHIMRNVPLRNTINTGGHRITNFHFANDIDGLASKEEELVNLRKKLDETFSRYSMEMKKKTKQAHDEQ